MFVEAKRRSTSLSASARTETDPKQKRNPVPIAIQDYLRHRSATTRVARPGEYAARLPKPVCNNTSCLATLVASVPPGGRTARLRRVRESIYNYSHIYTPDRSAEHQKLIGATVDSQRTPRVPWFTISSSDRMAVTLIDTQSSRDAVQPVALPGSTIELLPDPAAFSQVTSLLRGRNSLGGPQRFLTLLLHATLPDFWPESIAGKRNILNSCRKPCSRQSSVP